MDSGFLKARFTKLPPAEEGASVRMPADGGTEVLIVDAILCEGGTEVEVSVPPFKESQESFDAAVQLSIDGHNFGGKFLILQYLVAGKKK